MVIEILACPTRKRPRKGPFPYETRIHLFHLPLFDWLTHTNYRRARNGKKSTVAMFAMADFDNSRVQLNIVEFYRTVERTKVHTYGAFSVSC